MCMRKPREACKSLYDDSYKCIKTETLYLGGLGYTYLSLQYRTELLGTIICFSHMALR
jgi:hypothetical protein